MPLPDQTSERGQTGAVPVTGTILLIDDTSDVADIVRRSLGERGHSVVTASSAVDGVTKLATEQVDLILLEAVLPGIDGFTLLKKMRQATATKHLPIIMLTALRGAADVRNAVQSGATDYVLKPFDAESLTKKVEFWLNRIRELGVTRGGTTRVRKEEKSDHTPARLEKEEEKPATVEDEVGAAREVGQRKLEPDEILNQLKDLPPLPHSAAKIIELMQNPEIHMRELTKVITLDEALSGKVLKLAQSSYYGQGSRVKDVNKALVVIGINEMRHLVMGNSLMNALSRRQPVGTLDRQEFWLHSLTVAVFGKRIAQKIELEDPERLFLAGLLHDIGKLVIQDQLPREARDILTVAASRGKTYREAEETVLGLTHVEVGNRLLRKWELPDFLRNVVKYHHTRDFPEQVKKEDVQLIRIVQAANLLSKASRHGLGGDRCVEVWRGRAWKELGLESYRTVKMVMSDAQDEIRVHCNFMNVTRESGDKHSTGPKRTILLCSKSGSPVDLLRISLENYDCFLKVTDDIRSVRTHAKVSNLHLILFDRPDKKAFKMCVNDLREDSHLAKIPIARLVDSNSENAPETQVDGVWVYGLPIDPKIIIEQAARR